MAFEFRPCGTLWSHFPSFLAFRSFDELNRCGEALDEEQSEAVNPRIAVYLRIGAATQAR